jgi:diguanylate cyclase (GGDEF)-like protein
MLARYYTPVGLRIAFYMSGSKKQKHHEKKHESYERLIDAITNDDIDSILETKELSHLIKLLDHKLLEELMEKIKKQNAQLKHMAQFDSLTHLANRALFEISLKTALANAKRYEHIFAILFIDLDNFKIINDDLGHHIGDLVLKEAAKRLRDNIREGDTAARFGGDEFAIILSHIREEKDAGAIADKLIKILGECYHLEGNQLNVTASIGIACFPSAGEKSKPLIKHADAAMYKAKKAGRNQYSS